VVDGVQQGIHHSWKLESHFLEVSQSHLARKNILTVVMDVAQAAVLDSMVEALIVEGRPKIDRMQLMQMERLEQNG